MIDVAVLGGGISAEHEVSIRSATEVLAGLDRARWRRWPVFLARDGAWHAPLRAAAPDETPELGPEIGPPVAPGAALVRLLEAGVTLMFPALHGRGGEDGTLQGMFDLHRIAYVGSGAAASAVAMDKIRTRECLVAHGVPMARAVVGSVREAAADPGRAATRIGAEVGFPCFLKIDLSGSSYGVARCEDEDAVRTFFGSESGRRWVAEQRLVGEEISVPVLGNGGGLRALPPVGIYPVHDSFFDVRAKYEPGRTEEVIPPRGLDAETIGRVQRLAVICHDALGCDGVSRTDMIVTEAGPHVLEVNTIPGLTRESLLPKCAAEAGMTFPALLDELLELALSRARAEGAPS